MATRELIEIMKTSQVAAKLAERNFLLDQGWEEQTTTPNGTTWWWSGNQDDGSEPQSNAVVYALQNYERANVYAG